MAKAKQKTNWYYWLAFTVCVIALTEFFSAYKYFEADENVKGLIVVAVSLAAFILTLIYMAYQTYVDEKEKNNLQVVFLPFERVYELFKTRRGGA